MNVWVCYSGTKHHLPKQLFCDNVVGSEKSRFCVGWWMWCSPGARVLGDGLRALADGMLSELAGQQETDGGLDLAARDRRALEHLVDVDSITLPPSPTMLLVTAAWGLYLADRLLSAFRCCFRRHIQYTTIVIAFVPL